VAREPGTHVRIDAVGVSRRHVMIIITDDEVTLQDLPRP